MKISELKAGAQNVEVEAEVAEKGEPREVITKYGRRTNVANVTLRDASGSITLSLWGKDIDTVNVGDKIKISNGYVGEFRGVPQLSVGKFGKMEVVEKGSGNTESSESEDESEEEY
ncbi:OB-fold nucleic acid binding domain-containing protein [Candidatus Marsarchaeota archaeon]|nr:OB-fold nucleic acid binding domain-containing protein [Candidatus Marsarchaeota archaeon]